MAENFHPTADLSNDSFSRTGIKFIDISPPVADEILDDKDVRQSFSDYPIIPYSGSSQGSSHKLVEVLYNFKSMSSTFAGILKSLKTYALGKKLQVVQQTHTVFDVGDEREVSNTEKKQFVEFVDSVTFHNCNIIQFAYELSDSQDTSGQMGVEVVTRIILGETNITIKFHRPPNYCFAKDEPLGTMIYVSRKWDPAYLKKHPPLAIPVYPLEGTYEKGVTRTFFFYKENGTLYGRPSDLACLWDKYNEFKMSEYITKKTKKLFIPDLIIETSDPNVGAIFDEQSAKDQGYRNAADKFEKKFTNAGTETMNVIMTNRSEAARPMVVHELRGIQDADQVKGYFDMFKERILNANNWPELLLSYNAKTGFSTNEFFDVFSIVSVTKILEKQTILSTFINNIINYAYKKHNKQNELGIKFTSPLQTMLDEYRDSKRSNPELSGGQGVDSTKPAGV